MKKKIILFALLCLIFIFRGVFPGDGERGGKTALLIIDVQEFYFPGGALPLHEPEKAAANIENILVRFRAEKMPVVHIRHNVKKGGEIIGILKPVPGEKVISKDHANSFRDTELLKYLKGRNIGTLVITGMQTHMCVEAATRAAADQGFNCIVISDACTTRDLKFNSRTVSAADVHSSTLSSLSRTYARITDTESWLKENGER